MGSLLNSGKILPSLYKYKITKESKLINNQSGQTMVEFILLFLILVLISFSFIKILNFNLAKYWVALVTLIIDDPSVTINIP